MSDNQGGAFYYALVGGTCVIKPVGSITWKISVEFENFLDRVLGDGSITSFFIDLSETTYIDSTNLGLLARIHLATTADECRTAALHSTHAAINSILDDVGFTAIFTRSHGNPFVREPFRPITLSDNGSDQRQVILEAHRDLARLNDRNHETFQPIVDQMERDMSADA